MEIRLFTIILMICLGTVLYLTVQALPRIEEVPSDEKGFLERWAHSEVPEKIDAAFNNFFQIFAPDKSAHPKAG